MSMPFQFNRETSALEKKEKVKEHLSSHRVGGVKSVANRLHELARLHKSAAEALLPELSSAHG